MAAWGNIFTKGNHSSGKDRYLVLDIGTDAVKALVFSAREEEKGKKRIRVEGCGKSHIRLGDFAREMIVNPKGVERSCRKAITRAETMAGIKTQGMILTVGGNYVRGASTTIKIPREAPLAKITLNEIKNIFQKVHFKAVERIRSESTGERGIEQSHGIRIANVVVQDVKIDGYEVESPLGLTGKIIAFNVFHTYLLPSYLEIIHTLAKSLDREVTSLFQPSYSVFKTMRAYQNLSDFILLDVGGNSTEISLVKKGVLAGIKEFGVGGRTLSQRIEKNLGIGFWEANHIKLAYSRAKVSQYVSRRISKILEKDIAMLIAGIEISLKELSLLTILPPRMFVYGGGAGLKQFKDALSRNSWISPDLSFSHTPEIIFMKAKDLDGIYIDMTKKIKGSSWVVPLASAKEFVDSPREDVIQKTFHAITRVMQP